MKTSNVLIIGFGQHARRIYYPIASQLDGVAVVGVVDSTERRVEIEEYLQKEDINIARHFVDKRHTELDALTKFAKHQKTDAVFISTNPECHVNYAKWAFKNGFHVLMDKPIDAQINAAHDVYAAKQIHQQYLDLLQDLKEARKEYPDLICEVLAQRRFHPAYKLVKSTIDEIFSKTRCPITYYYAFHNDGQWRLPQELLEIEYHGFEKGFGKASHSGYHFFDLLNWFTKSFQTAYDINNVLVKSWPNFIPNYLQQINPGSLSKVFPTHNIEQIDPKEFTKFGELDVMNTIQLKNDEQVVTHAQIDLLHSGLSARSWPEIGDRNLYKNNGRVRHEQHYVAMGPFASISLTSWQAKPFKSEKVSKEIFKPGHEFNLDITICRNAELVGGNTSETFTLTDIYKPELEDYSRGHQEDARKAAIESFFDNISKDQNYGESSLEDHCLSSQIMSQVYESMASKETVVNKVGKVV